MLADILKTAGLLIIYTQLGTSVFTSRGWSALRCDRPLAYTTMAREERQGEAEPEKKQWRRTHRKSQQTKKSKAPARAEACPQAAAPEKMSRKEYEKELAKLQVELVKMQEWVKATGAKICVLFEGRDAAGKGGTIKGITEKVSPRVFRVVAMPSPTGSREVADVHPALSAAPASGRRGGVVRPQLVQPRRRRARDGLHR